MSHHPHASIDRESSPQVEIDDEWLCEPTEVFIVQGRPDDVDDDDVTVPESLPLDDDEPELINLDTVVGLLRAPT